MVKLMMSFHEMIVAGSAFFGYLAWTEVGWQGNPEKVPREAHS